MFKNTKAKYGLISIIVHWLSALIVFGLFGLGYWMVELDYYSEWYRTAPYIHKSIGILLLGVTCFRIIWKLSTPSPKILSAHRLESIFAHCAHGLLYLILLTILISGYLISTADGRAIEVFNWFIVPSAGELFASQEDIAGEIHKIAAYLVMALVILHIIAALKHHFINKDNTLVRMLKP